MTEQVNGAEATSSEEIILDELSEGVDDPVVLRAQLDKEAEARRQLTARAKKAEADLREARKANIKEEPASKQINNEYSLNDEVVELRLDGYTKDDVTFIMKNGGRKALEDKTSYTSIAINARKEQVRAEAQANKLTDTSGMSEVERKYTPDQLKNMSSAELKKIVPHA